MSVHYITIVLLVPLVHNINTLKTYKKLKKCRKGIHMNCWEAMFIQTYHQDGTLITEQQVNEYNPLFELVNREHLTAQSPTS